MEWEHPVHFTKEASQAWGDYYFKKSQMGAGIGGYRAGVNIQRGDGLQDYFKFALPIVKYLGTKTANTLVRAGTDAFQGENLVESLKKHSKATAGNILDDIVEQTTSKLTGNGKKKYRKKKGAKKIKKKKKRSSKRKSKHSYFFR